HEGRGEVLDRARFEGRGLEPGAAQPRKAELVMRASPVERERADDTGVWMLDRVGRSAPRDVEVSVAIGARAEGIVRCHPLDTVGDGCTGANVSARADHVLDGLE